ncbi:hypothetical protein ACEPAH_1481 [Sanghuangporus vaninii]
MHIRRTGPGLDGTSPFRQPQPHFTSHRGPPGRSGRTSETIKRELGVQDLAWTAHRRLPSRPHFAVQQECRSLVCDHQIQITRTGAWGHRDIDTVQM